MRKEWRKKGGRRERERKEEGLMRDCMEKEYRREERVKGEGERMGRRREGRKNA